MSKTDWKLAKGKTWRQKLEEVHPNHGKIVDTPPHMQKRFGKGMMVISSPREVDRIIRTIRKGKLITQSQLRAQLARNAGVDAACPMTTGIFVRIVAEAAEEDRRAGKRRVTPWWRTIRDDGRLFEKLPGGPKAQAARLREEGFTIQPARGNQPPRVRNFESALVKLDE